MMLEVENVKKSFTDNQVIKDISFKIDEGEVVSILGPSGCGKTTLLRCLSFLERVDQGTMSLDGIKYDMTRVSAKDMRSVRMQMGFVFQGFNLFRHMTAMENVMEGLLSVRKMDKSKAKEIAMEMLEKVGMADKADFYPDELSGGQHQRVAIARALAPNPRVVLFDEPTSALDPELTVEVLEVIKKLAKEGTTMIVVTHEINFAREVSSRIVVLDGGVVIEEGPTREVLDNPKVERTRQFLRVFEK